MSKLCPRTLAGSVMRRSAGKYTLAAPRGVLYYRKRHTINQAVGAGTDYQVRVRINRGTGVDLGENVYVNNLCRPDYGDIRFISTPGNVLLDHWMELQNTEHYMTGWVKSAFNPLTPIIEVWVAGFYNDETDRVYIFYNPLGLTNQVHLYSFTWADWQTFGNWTNHGLVLSTGAIGQWDDNRIEAHSIVWETQAMADAREGVPSGQGTRMWRLYYCGFDGAAWSIGFAYASESDPLTWTKYAGNPVYGFHNALWHPGESIADPEAFIYSATGNLVMAVRAYGGPWVNGEWFTESADGITGWVDQTAGPNRIPLDATRPCWGTCYNVDTDDLISWISAPPPVGGVSAWCSEDYGNSFTASAANPVIPLGPPASWEDTDHDSPILIKDKDENFWFSGFAYCYYIGQDAGGNTRLGVARTNTETDLRYAYFWVEIDENLTTANRDLFVYYGHLTYTSAVDCVATFIQCDLFANLAAWTLEEDTGAEVISIVNDQVRFRHRTNAYCHIERAQVQDEICARFMGYPTGGEATWAICICVYFNQYDYARVMFRPGLSYRFQRDINGVIGNTDAGACAGNTWHWARIRVTPTTVYGDYSTDGITWVNIGSVLRPGTWPNISLTIIGHGYEVNAGSYPNPDLDNSWGAPGVSIDTFADQYLLRKYVFPEPVHGAWGAQQRAYY